MTNVEIVRKLAMDFEEVIESPHFEKTSFRVKGKIFATFEERSKRLVVKMNDIDQSVFSDGNTIYPVKGKWGKKGWTVAILDHLSLEQIQDLLRTAYCTVAPKKLAKHYQASEDGCG